jgi:hypothetical protein
MASIERTAYPRFKRFMSARELHVFYTPQPDEIVWAREAASSDGHLLALVTQDMAIFARAVRDQATPIPDIAQKLKIQSWEERRKTPLGRTPLPRPGRNRRARPRHPPVNSLLLAQVRSWRVLGLP